MDIIGPEAAIFGVDDLDASFKCLRDYGLKEVDKGSGGAVFEAADGTHMEFRRASDTGLAPAIAPSPNIREMIYGVTSKTVLQQIGAELAKDRQVKLGADGILRTTDDSGYPIGFQVSIRRPIKAEPLLINVPGQAPQRPPNMVAANMDARPHPLTLSHIVLWVPDLEKAQKFYIERLGFRITDRFLNAGVFLRPAGTMEHHTLFLIKAMGGHAIGLNHITFHLAGANEVLQAGTRFERHGWETFWGPGRHVLGSNYFWYFKSPFGGEIEYDADMDLHDDNWKPRDFPLTVNHAQIWLFNAIPFWTPASPFPRVPKT